MKAIIEESTNVRVFETELHEAKKTTERKEFSMNWAKWTKRVILIIIVGMCGILLLATYTKSFNYPNLMISFLMGVAWILALAGLIFILWGVSGLFSTSEEDKGKTTLANPETPVLLLGIYCGLLSTAVFLSLSVTGHFSTGFQKETSELLHEILDYLKVKLP